jgi:hypothetical protein
MVPSKNIYNIKRHINNNRVGYTCHMSKMINNVTYNLITLGYATHQIANRTLPQVTFLNHIVSWILCLNSQLIVIMFSLSLFSSLCNSSSSIIVASTLNIDCIIIRASPIQRQALKGVANEVVGPTLGCNHCLISIMVNGYLNWCWIFCMNLYKNIFNVLLWKHLVNFEINLMSMEYPKPFLKNVTNIFFP